MGQTGALALPAALPRPYLSPLDPLRSGCSFATSQKGTSISCVRMVNRHRPAPAIGEGNTGWGMGKITIAFVLVIASLLLGGAVFLALWNPPAPSAPVEKVLPDARFPK